MKAIFYIGNKKYHAEIPARINTEDFFTPDFLDEISDGEILSSMNPPYPIITNLNWDCCDGELVQIIRLSYSK